jgi:hypothetical protein
MMISIPNVTRTVQKTATTVQDLAQHVNQARREAHGAARLMRMPGTGVLRRLVQGENAVPDTAKQAITHLGPQQRAFFRQYVSGSGTLQQAVDGLETNPVKAGALRKAERLLTGNRTTKAEDAARVLSDARHKASLGGRGQAAKEIATTTALTVGGLAALTVGVAGVKAGQDNVATRQLLATPNTQLQTEQNKQQTQQFLNSRGIQGEVTSIRRQGDNRLVANVTTPLSSLTDTTNDSTRGTRTVVLQRDAFPLDLPITGRSSLTVLPQNKTDKPQNLLAETTTDPVRQYNPATRLLGQTPDLSKVTFGFKDKQNQTTSANLRLPSGGYVHQASVLNQGMPKLFSDPKLATLQSLVLPDASGTTKAVVVTDGIAGQGKKHENAQVVLKIKTAQGNTETVAIPIQGDIMRPSSNQHQYRLTSDTKARVYSKDGTMQEVTLGALNAKLADEKAGFEVLTPTSQFTAPIPPETLKSIQSSPAYKADAQSRKDFALQAKQEVLLTGQGLSQIKYD